MNKMKKFDISIIICLVLFLNIYNILYSQSIAKYDNLSRLIQVTNTNGTIVKYTYDELGNRSTKVITTASYAITASASPVAGGTVAGSGSFSAGQSCTLTATPNAGYAFSNWTEGATVVSSNASYAFTVSTARTLVANFVQSPVNYTINTSASPTAGGTTTGGGTYASGASRTVTATANTGFTFTNWTENGSVVSTAASYTFNLSANRTLVANFTLNSYAIAATANPTVGGTVTGAGSYNYGSSCTLTASPKTGYTFTNWTENGIEISSNSTLSFTVTAARSVTANFVATAYTLNLSNNALSLDAAANSSGTITITSNTTWTANSNQAWLTVSPTSSSNNGTLTLTANTANSSATARTATVTVSGTGVANQTITVTQLGTAPALSLSNNTLSINAATNSSGTISITSNTAWSASSNQTWLTVSPASGSNNGTLTLTANSANTATTTRTATVTVTGTGVTAQAITVTQTETGIVNYNVSITSNPYEGGTTTGSGTFVSGSSKTVTATANTGYTFANWTESGTIVSTNASYTFNLSANRTLVANFTTNSAITVSFKKPTDWGTANVSLWAWTSDGTNLFTAWPGIVMSNAGNGWYSYTFDKSVTNVNVIFSKVGNPQTVDITGITQSTCYQSVGLSGVKLTVSAVSCSPTGLDSYVIQKNPIKLHPNPAHTYLNISSSEIIKRIEICDITGKIIDNKIINSDCYILDLTDLLKGVYLIKGFTEGGVKVGKFVKE